MMKDFWLLTIRLVKQDLQGRFAGSFLGSFWIFIWPLVQLFIYIVIFGKMMGGRLAGSGQSYGLYVASGLLAWTCFANTLLRTTRIFVEKRNIIGKVRVDLRVFPFSVCLDELLTFAFGLSLLFCAGLGMGWRPAGDLLAWLLFALYCQQMLAVGLGLFFACCAVFVRDIMEVVSIGTQMLFWFTPIVYMPSILPDWVKTAVYCQPMTHIAGIFQNCFVFGGEVVWSSILYILLVAHAALALGLYTLKRWQKDIRDVL